MVIPARAVHGADAARGTANTPEMLIRRVGRGDEEAFAELYDIVAGPVLGIATRVLRDHARSEEVTMDVLMEIWQRAPEFDAQRHRVLPWAMTVAHRRAVDRVRAAEADTRCDSHAGQSELRWCFDEIVETTLDRIEHDAVRRSLDELTELQRRSLVLAYYGGYTDNEVSEALDKPVGTVKARMRDGLIRMRDAMAGQP
ncbi:sigma-70 family RNA polymerase sigma factor [Nocardia altamirensis]|uniref:sigma-70 family RNA polymerase sigma factor n=1 Tax=Nocardia altamirensis TaxID=472158 RepID=UPI00083FEE65|nr:sigma-70 family RNA polymerase sigma factor [Nocardia altamirensis]